MKKEIVATCILAMLFISTVNAQPVVSVRTDKPTYLPGEKGRIYVTFHNKDDDPVQIYNITVRYDQWEAYVDNNWVGNETIYYDNYVVTGKAVGQLDPVEFVVPSDGRAVSCSVTVELNTTKGTYEAFPKPFIAVVETPYFMEQIITLFTILVVLLIVCTIIIAATIFLSRRRPPVTWREERAAETG